MVLVLAALLAGACTRTPARLPGTPVPALPAALRVGEPGRGQPSVHAWPLDQYVLASILSELAPTGLDAETAERLFEVQAIVSRTYAVANLGRHAAEGFDLCTTTHCQRVDTRALAGSRWRTVAERAVARTAGVILVYDTRPASTVFHADCGGHTSAGRDVWGGEAHPYLAARRDDAPGRPEHQRWQVELDRAELRRALNHDSRTAVGSHGPALRVLRRDAVGRVLELEARGERTVRLRAEDFRARLGAELGPRALRSAWFTLHERGDRLRFDGRGFGHGVGLCQLGARARIVAGVPVPAVLAAYYPGTRLLAAGVHTGPPTLTLLVSPGALLPSF